MSRINKLETHYKELLKYHNKVDNVSEFIQSILNADVTKGKYARFLINCFLNEKFLEEDLTGGLESTVGQAIRLFHKYKSKLPEDMRSVFKYNSPGDLWNSVKQFQGELSGKELKKEEQEQVYRETEFVYKDEETGFQIISPLTEDSAKWWGKGTRWCTSAEKNNMFEHYAQDAPLFILLMPNGDKLQLWIWKDELFNDIQFMDEADNEIELEYIEQNWNILKPICLWLKNLRLVPEEYRTKELCELAVKQNGEALYYVLEKYITQELCNLAVQQNGMALEFVPLELRTSLYKLAIQNNGEALQHVPEEYRTKELCELAVKNNGYAIYYIPEELKTEELYKTLVKKDGDSLRFFPERLKTKEICEIAVKHNGCLCHVPYKYRTLELCELAVQQDEYALEFVPDKYREELKNYVKDEVKHRVKDEIFEIPMEKYQEIFQEIKTLFPQKDIFLDCHHI